MAYRLITGQYVIRYPENPLSGPAPDGDTVKFRPDDPVLVEELGRLSGVAPKLSAQGRISLRLEAIDALETHFEGLRQDEEFGDAARDSLLERLGFRDVVFDPDRPGQVARAAADAVDGWVLSNGVEQNGRLVAFAFTGRPPLADGSLLDLEPDLAATSANIGLLSDGLVYPLLYSTLPLPLREAAATIARTVREQGRGLWQRATADPASAADLTGRVPALADLVIWPKLFRRLVAYYGAGFDDLAGLRGWLTANPETRDDPILVVADGRIVRLHDLVEVGSVVAGGDPVTIRLTEWPDALVVLPAGAGAPAPVPPAGPTVPGRVRTGAVRVVAALVDPAGPDAGRETVTLLNTTASAVALDGWTLGDAHGDEDTLSGTLSAGEALRLRLTAVALGNSGDTLTLRSPDRRVVDRVTYRAVDLLGPGRTLIL